MYALVNGRDIGLHPGGQRCRTDYVEYLRLPLPAARAEGYPGAGGLCQRQQPAPPPGSCSQPSGADFTIINDTPDGININVDCGSTHIEQLLSPGGGRRL